MEIPAAWYAQGEGLRWWDGARWTGMRVKNGRPGVDWITAENPVPLFVSSALFLVAGGVYLFLSVRTPPSLVLGALFLALAVFWFLGALQTRRVAVLPAPAAAPVVIDAVHPLPGEEEGSRAGWYPVSPTVRRWWTGARWSEYTWTRYGIRPTFHGPRSFRLLLWVEGIFAGLGAVAVIAGSIVVSGAAEPVATAIGAVLIVAGAATLLAGVLLLALSPVSRRTLLVPSSPPAPAPPAAGDVAPR